MELNPGIVKTVKLLNDNGWVTTDSGDGETHDYECDQEYGYVAVLLDKTKDMEQAANEVYDLLKANVKDWGNISIEANYSPIDQYKIVYVSYIHDRQLI